MPLFEIPKQESQVLTKKSPIKLKKGITIYDLIKQAEKLVEEKLSKYKNASKCITNINDLKKFFNETPDNGIIGIDTETTGLDTFKDKMVGLSLCNGKEVLYVPVNHINPTFGTRLSNQIPEQEIRDLFKELNTIKHYRYVYHNAKFDLAVFYQFLGFPMPAPYWDTLIGGHIIYQEGDHNLKLLYNKYIAEEDEGVNRFDTLFKGITFDYIPLSIATIYAGKDALMTYELYQWQKNYFEESGHEKIYDVFMNIEMPLIPILAQMFQYGVNINQHMLGQLYKKYCEKLKDYETEVFNEIAKNKDKIDEYKLKHPKCKLDDPINLKSPSQLSILFYDILNYTSKTGKTGEEELEEIGTDLTKAILNYKKMTKLVDAFLISLPKQVEPSTGKIHTNLNQYGAKTGRFSSSGPNLQQIPSRGEAKEIRRVFGASNGYILLSSDFSQQEPRCLACLANEVGMQTAYRTGKDLYATMAAEIYSKPYGECLEFLQDDNGHYIDFNGNIVDEEHRITNKEGKARRSSVKGILLGLMYGRSTASVAEQIHSTVEEAQKITDDFFNAYPGIRVFIDEQQQITKARGYTETAWGRRRIIPHIQDNVYSFSYNDKRPVDFNPLLTVTSYSNDKVPEDTVIQLTEMLENTKNAYYKKQLIDSIKNEGIDVKDNHKNIGDAKRQVVNSIIQGSASDITKRAMIMLGTNEELKKLGFQMLFPVHDEVIAECPFENRQRCAELMSKLMIESAQPNITVKMKCDVEAFFYWYGPSVKIVDDPIAQKQYNDYITTGKYLSAEEYK